MNIYNLTTEMQTLYDRLIESVDEETGEVDLMLANALAVKKEEFEEKALNYTAVIRILNEQSNAAQAEILRITEIKDKIDRTITNMKKTLSAACLSLDIVKIQGLNGSISFRESVQTVIDDAEQLPKDYLKEKITYTPDKAAIKAAIQNGEEVAGAHLEKVKNIQIK